jgi:hypothetical protein
MSIIDNTLAAQVPTFDPATPLAKMAQLQAANQEIQQAQFKQNQLELGSEMRGVQPFVNTPEFPAKWREAADRLRQKGVINDQMHEQWANAPSPLLLKSIISQTDSPEMAFRKDESVRTQKNTDRTYGLQERTANRLEDQTPDNFEANPDYGKVEGAPKYRPLSGGPTDPNYLTAVAAAAAKVPKVVGEGAAIVVPETGEVKYENKAAKGPTIDDETANFAAEQILQGAKGIKTGYGRGAQGPENIAKIDAAVARLAKERNISPSELVQRGIDLVGDTSRERTAATQEARMAAAGIEAQGALKLGKEASDAVPRTKWVAVNKAIQAYQSNTSDPDLKKFGAANLTIINTYARAINPNGVGTVADKEHASEMLKTADGPEAYNAVIEQLNKEIEMAHNAPVKARQGFRDERAARVGGKDAVVLQQARNAIAAGADRAAVLKRLEAAGLDPSKL